MSDVRRFMRYILPGLAFAVELLVALFLSHDICALYYKINLPTPAGTPGTIGVVFGAFLASGALGYIFSLIYWGVYWISPNSRLAMDFLTIFRNLENEKKIELFNQHGVKRSAGELTKHQGWTLSCQYWCHQKENSEKIKGIDPYIDRLIDITHGIGTTIVSTFFSVLLWIYIRYFFIKQPPVSIYSLTLIFWIILFYFFIKNYFTIQKAVENLTNSTILNEILEEFKNDTPVRIFFVEKQ